MFIINPGTENQKDTTEENAIKIAKIFAQELDIPNLKLRRYKKRDDNRGWYGFNLILGDIKVELDIPGVEPDVFLKSKPFESPRCYINGSSWLYNFALDIARGDLLELEE